MADLSHSHTLLGADTSNLTGAVWFVGDFRQLTISIQSASGNASRYTIIGTDENGFRSLLSTSQLQTGPVGVWSVVTVLTAQGLYTFDPYPGFRWINAFRDSSSLGASCATIRLNGRT